ncbi:MAG: nuclear transport factor 2 family protein [Thermoleophilaceae bacterium]
MSEQNIETMRRFHEFFNNRDVDAFLELMHPDVELVPITARLEGTVYRGYAEIRDWLRRFDEDWELFQTHPLEYRDLGDHVLILGTWDARARTSGVTLDAQPGAWVATLRDGKIARQETFTNREEALEAVGLRE